ncbi:MAG: ABC transporter substrate-binding protein, partial [Bifidobacterium crudilactis]|nr:ABC transporter substrate-binding protein [Bifidobacterium crudilactis]
MKSLRKLMTVSVAAILSVSTLAACGSGSDSTASAGASASSDTKSASATSLSDFGGMDGLVKAANAEGALNVIALPHDWSNYGEVISAFKKKYPKIKVTEA